MHTAPTRIHGLARLIFPALLGFVVGTALQLQQETLYPWQTYGFSMLLVLPASILVATRPIDVLLVPHHGSKTSSSAAFLNAVQPQLALVQAGYRNRFGHPAQPVLVRYAERHIRMVDSPHCGAATLRSTQPQLIHCQRTEGMRYWHHRLP
jgi:hypothetical protein